MRGGAFMLPGQSEAELDNLGFMDDGPAPESVVEKVEAWLAVPGNVESLRPAYAEADRLAKELTGRSRRPNPDAPSLPPEPVVKPPLGMDVSWKTPELKGFILCKCGKVWVKSGRTCVTCR